MVAFQRPNSKAVLRCCLIVFFALLWAKIIIATVFGYYGKQIKKVQIKDGRRAACTPRGKALWISNTVDVDTLRPLVQSRANNNTILITFSSSSQSLLLNNWLCSLKSHRVSNFLVVSFDNSTHQEVQQITESNQTSFYDSDLFAGKTVNWRRDASNQEEVWRELMSFKVAIVESILEMGYDVFVTDVDTSLLRNPFNYISSNQGCDMQFQPDRKDKFTLEDYEDLIAFNCGVYFVRSSPSVLQFYKIWRDSFNCEEGNREQGALRVALNYLMKHYGWDLYFHKGFSLGPNTPLTTNPVPSINYGGLLRMIVSLQFLNRAIEEVSEPTEKITLTTSILDRDRMRLPEPIKMFPLKMCYLDPSKFPNGGAYFINHHQFVETHGRIAPAVVHTNYMKGKLDRKLAFMQISGAWYLDEVGRCIS